MDDCSNFTIMTCVSVFYSCNMMLNMDYFVEELWEHLGLIRVYTKRQGKKPDFDDPLILRGGCSIEHVVSFHRSIIDQDLFLVCNN